VVASARLASGKKKIDASPALQIIRRINFIQLHPDGRKIFRRITGQQYHAELARRLTEFLSGSQPRRVPSAWNVIVCGKGRVRVKRAIAAGNAAVSNLSAELIEKNS
jgi:hypothetical protein